jgi:acyl dehydratase/NAD(P)-dependent dehydrogenase (short-subunit alcohol dehydrogenase family)
VIWTGSRSVDIWSQELAYPHPADVPRDMKYGQFNEERREAKDPVLLLGEKIFGPEDQDRFARMSGDFNPMHIDAVAARRLITGRQVVHGINVLLHAIEFALRRQAVVPVCITCTFNNPVSVGDRAMYLMVKATERQQTIAVTVADLVCATVVLDADGPQLAYDGSQGSTVVEDMSVLAEPANFAPDEHVGKVYRIGLDGLGADNDFPSITKHMSRQYISSMGALSCFVGMVCPGLHSIFSSLKVWTTGIAQGHGSLSFSVARFDERFRIFQISVSGFLAGELKAFQRPAPATQQSMAEITSYVTSGEFSGTRSLIVGGSRGLGELTAKLLAGGGGNTVITYAQSRDDAMRVASEINAGGTGACESVQFDVMHDAISSAGIDFNSLDMLYYFATPRIHRKKARIFDEAIHEEFLTAYVKRFFAICAYFEENVSHKVVIYVPSSVFVEQRESGYAEYAMAKAAAEVLIVDINRKFKRVMVHVTRLPKLNTDQTSSLFGIGTGSNVETLLPILRTMRAAVSADMSSR